VTVKFNPSLTKVLWRAVCRSKTKGVEATHIVRDGRGNVFITGTRRNSAGDDDVLTIKYGATGRREWLKAWSGGGPDDDRPSGIVLGTRGGVYVGGQATAKGGVHQAMLLKYQR